MQLSHPIIFVVRMISSQIICQADVKLAPLGIAYNDHGGKLSADKVISDQETLIGVKIEKAFAAKRISDLHWVEICSKTYLRSVRQTNWTGCT